MRHLAAEKGYSRCDTGAAILSWSYAIRQTIHLDFAATGF